ncbi:HNH endonuclease [Candidatus Parcubacteria bacterium]|nr:HNH endonuclease [Candidatus Parcubacteria bacterium]
MRLPNKKVLYTFISALFIIFTALWTQLFFSEPQSVTVLEPKWFLNLFDGESATRERVANVLTQNEGQTTFGAVTKTSSCAVRGPLPDPNCTPGSVFTDLTLERMCTPGYTKEVRNVSTKLKAQIYAAYNIEYPQPTGSYELDHLIPLALGGSNDASNLFPESEEPNPGFKEKDVVEVYLQEEVCAGHVALALAQVQIAKDWLAVYNEIDKSVVSRIKQKYSNWSN